MGRKKGELTAKEHKSPTKIRLMYQYSKENNKDIEELTFDEFRMFLGEPDKFPHTAHPMIEGFCYICGNKTLYVDKFHIVYTCSQKCVDELDMRYDEGEEIKKNKKIYQILEDNERNLFE